MYLRQVTYLRDAKEAELNAAVAAWHRMSHHPAAKAARTETQTKDAATPDDDVEEDYIDDDGSDDAPAGAANTEEDVWRALCPRGRRR